MTGEYWRATGLQRFLLRMLVCCIAPLFASNQSTAALIFDNGPTDPTNTAWNATEPVWTAVDDFAVTSHVQIHTIQYDLFRDSGDFYIKTIISILDGVVGNEIVAPFEVVATETSNGLSHSNPAVADGFTHTVDGLSIDLAPGTYFLTLSIDILGGPSTPLSNLAGIGSGPGSPDTIGDGLWGVSSSGAASQVVGDHMAFQLQGTQTTPVPEPGSMALFGIGGVAIVLRRHRKRRSASET